MKPILRTKSIRTKVTEEEYRGWRSWPAASEPE